MPGNLHNLQQQLGYAPICRAAVSDLSYQTQGTYEMLKSHKPHNAAPMGLLLSKATCSGQDAHFTGGSPNRWPLSLHVLGHEHQRGVAAVDVRKPATCSPGSVTSSIPELLAEGCTSTCQPRRHLGVYMRSMLAKNAKWSEHMKGLQHHVIDHLAQPGGSEGLIWASLMHSSSAK